MADDIVERLRATCKANKDCPHAPCLGYCLPLEAADEIERTRKEVDLKGYRLDDALDEIERLRALCSDLYHDATCTESFCRLCGEGIQEWEARRG